MVLCVCLFPPDFIRLHTFFMLHVLSRKRIGLGRVRKIKFKETRAAVCGGALIKGRVSSWNTQEFKLFKYKCLEKGAIFDRKNKESLHYYTKRSRYLFCFVSLLLQFLGGREIHSSVHLRNLKFGVRKKMLANKLI